MKGEAMEMDHTTDTAGEVDRYATSAEVAAGGHFADAVCEIDHPQDFADSVWTIS